IHKDLGETLRIAGGLDNAASASDANLRVDSENGELRIKLATSLTDLEEIQVGKDGVDGVDGTIGVNGKDGASVVLNGKDGSIGLTGPRGADGSDGASTNISVKDGAPGVDGADGTTTTRIVYTDPELGEQEVANLNDGLKFVGDDGNTVTRKLNQTLGLTGGAAAADLTGEGNIGVIQKDDGALSIQLAKDIDLTADGSLTTGDTVVNDKGLVVHDVTANPTATTRVEAGKIELFANPQGGSANTIVLDAEKGTIEGLSNRDLNAADFATAGRAATEEQLKLVNSNLTDAGLNFAGNSGDEIHKDLGETLNIVGGLDNTASASDANLRVDSENGELRIKLATSLTDLENIQVGKDGADGVDGTIGVNGKDGASVVLNGKDGSIGLTGPAGANGEPGASANISVKDGAPGLDGNDGVNGESKTRIVYEKPDGITEEVATLNDGLKFVGDDGNTVTRKLNETLGLTGGADVTNLSANNIGVVQKDDGSLSIQLAKDLAGLNSATFTDGTNTTIINSSGLAITDGPSVTVDGIDGGNKQITGVASGLGSIDLADATGDTLTNAANIGDLQTATNSLAAAGLNFAGNTGDEIHKDLGETLRIAGGLDNAASASDANLRVDSENGELRIKLATSLTDLEEIQVGKDGVDGVDGTIGVNGKDGASVVLNGKDGSIGLTGPRGADGSDGASTNISVKDGAPGVDGADGTTTTRIVYTDPELGEQEVANLNDGLKFVGDDGNTVTRKLNQTLGLTGGAAAADLTGEGNIGVIQKDDGALSIQLAKDIDLTADGSLTTGDTVVNDKGLVVHDVTANPTATTRVEAGKIELFANPQGGSANTIVLDAEKGTIEGLSNRDLNAADFATAGRAATEEQLAIVNETANKGWNVTTNADDATSENVAPGATVDFDNTDDNIVIAQDKTSLTFDLAKNIKVDSINAGGTFLNSNGLSFVNGSGVQLPNTVFIKPDGIDMGGNKITKLAKGEISATSTDAVNGSQLSFLADSVKNIFGGDVSFDFENGTFTSPTYTINGKDYSTVQAAIDELAKGWSVTVSDPGGSNPGTDTGGNPGVGTPETGTGGPADILPGDQLTLVAGDNIDIVQKPKTDGNVGIEISVDPNLVVNSVTAGKTVMDDSGVKVGDNVHLGDTGLTVKGGPTGDLAFTADKVDVGGNKIQNVANGNIASGSKDAVNGGQIKDISQSVANALGGGSTVKNDGTVSAPSYTVGNKNEVVNNVGDAIDVLNQGWTLNVGGNNSQVQAGDKVSLLSNDGNIVITQVLGSAEVNFALNDTITVTEVNATTVNATTVNATTVNASTFQAGNTIVNNNGLSFVNNAGEQVGPSVSVTGINAGGSTITNVAAGVNDTDAVNVGQLKGVANNLTNQINSVRGDLKRVDRDARAGTASAAAMANLPQAYLPGKSMFAVSTAGHRGEQGFAAGLSTITDNGKWVLKGSVSGNSRGDVTYGAGVGYQW
ncbi:YadA-like family protein, partial [Advenella alkanexedens]